jgi:hypothetical protein
MFLFFMDPMVHGSAVRRLQEMLLGLGFDVGKYGPDGWFGTDTLEAVLNWQLARNLPPSGVVTDEVWKQLEKDSMSRGTCIPIVKLDQLGGIVDTRGEHPHPKWFRQDRSPRSWDDIDGVTVHQTACILSDRPSRWGTLNAHIGIFRDGTIIIVNDPTDFIWHAQGFSHKTIGIEYNGNFPGIEGNPRTHWAPGGKMCSLTPQQIAATPVLFKWLKKQFDDNGAKWKYVYAHRQATKDRRADPGSEIWQKVAMPWIEELGASDGGPDFLYGTGRTIPKEWNPNYTSKY